MPSLGQLPLPFRALFTSFMLMIGFGYLMALCYLFMLDILPHQQMGMGVVAGIEMKYHGDREGSRLEAALRGVMADRLDDGDKDRLLDWVRSGAPESGYPSVKPIFDKNCIACHNPSTGLPVPPLNSYPNVRKLAQVDSGTSIEQLARVSHIHLFGISMIFLLTGTIFSFSALPQSARVLLVVLPYLSITADIGSWWLTHFFPLFGAIVVFGGAIMGLSMAMQIVVSLWEMWLPAPWSRSQQPQPKT
jgi:hypothetical protein